MRTKIEVQSIIPGVYHQAERFPCRKSQLRYPEGQTCGGTFKLVGGQRYAHVRSHLDNGLDIIGADRGVGRANRKVVVQVMHQVLDPVIILK